LLCVKTYAEVDRRGSVATLRKAGLLGPRECVWPVWKRTGAVVCSASAIAGTAFVLPLVRPDMDSADIEVLDPLYIAQLDPALYFPLERPPARTDG
jgi:hypothetical protein